MLKYILNLINYIYFRNSSKLITMLKAFKLLFLLTIVVTITFIINSCAKGGSSGPVVHINCDSLFNDSVTVADSADISIANAFTPNNDGLHDILYMNMKYNIFDSMHATLFDENNNVVYRSNYVGFTVNTTFPQGKYYYRFQFKTKKGKRVGKCGFLWILRCMPSNMPDSLDFTGDGFIPNYPLNRDPIQKTPCN